ncbi:hypothetical protein [Thalassospira mesophila]|uniref:Uncharacterized protein n=1 Tax=Thalassospira mesophila TaxID=1293891 RepID=A0A1Y2KZF2_9PROT|nr:hypothetical protein [Thalassospira mesophila]OSQ37835.1 hypothetical protein TMES_12620 [Thalassospira mesophila]
MEWIENHNSLLQIWISFATLSVWIVYAQILMSQYRRTRRPKILINQTRGQSLRARFLVSNMSQESVHIEVILVGLQSDGNEHWYLVSDWEPTQDDDQADTNRYGTFQGPLAAGSSLDIGDIRGLIAQRDAEQRDESRHKVGTGIFDENGVKCTSFEIMVVGVYSSENGVIGASRTFDINDEGAIHPHDAETSQCNKRRERKRMEGLHSRYL